MKEEEEGIAKTMSRETEIVLIVQRERPCQNLPIEKCKNH
jgi:hypothetical protein